MKNKKAIYLLFAANSISGFAQGISMIAIPWYFSNVINQPGVYGKIFWLVTVASLFWGLYVGSLVDQYNRKNLFLATSAVGGIILFSAAFSGFMSELIPVGMVALVFATTIFIFNIHYPTLYAFAQEISEPKDYGKITSYIEVQGQTSSALAGAFAAVLMKGTENGILNVFGFKLNLGVDVAAWNLHEIFLLDGCTYTLSILLVSMMQFTPIATRYKEQVKITERLKAGFVYLNKNRFIFLFGMLAASVFVAILVISYYLNPIYINTHLNQGADVYASYEFYFAIGSLLAGLFVQKVFQKLNAVVGVVTLGFVSAVCYFVCVFNQSLLVFYVVALLVGFSNAGSRVLRVNYLFQRIPNQVIGRTSSVFTVVNTLYRIIFTYTFSLPFFIAENNVVYAYLAFGIFIFISALILAFYYKQILNAESTSI